MLAKFSPAISSGLPAESTQLWSGHSAASRFGLSVQVAVVGVPWVTLPSDTATPGVPLLPLVAVWAMYTLPVAGSATWLPEIPSLPVTQSARPAPRQSVPGLVFSTGANVVPSCEIVSTNWLPPVTELSTAS